MRLARQCVLASVPFLGVFAGVAAGAPAITSQQYMPEGGTNYNNASAIPVSSTDLINGLLPVATNYVGSNEAAGGTAAPFTNGNTGTGTSDPTNNTNSLFQVGNEWVVTYQLPMSPGGYNLTSIVVTTGQQDARVNQQYDLFVSPDNVTYAQLNGTFNYSPATTEGGSAQSTVTDNAGGFLASGVNFVRFQARDNGNGVFRELDVNGSPVPEPTSLGLLGAGALGLLARRRRA